MSVEIWPPISPAELKIEEDATQARELSWLLTSLCATLAQIKRGLEDCCALLAPADSAGSTLALTTPRHETVKGHTTRVGARLVRGLVHLRLRTLPPQTLTLDSSRPIRVPALVRLDALLSRSLEMCRELEEHEHEHENQKKEETKRTAPPPLSAPHLASRLRLLALHIAEAAALVKGPPHHDQLPARPSTSASTASSSSHQHQHQHQPDHQHQQKLPLDTSWTTSSVPLAHFCPPLSRNLSLYVTVQDACLVLYLRALEPADAPVNFGTKLALAIGTTRRLEHDEADKVFLYRCGDESRIDSGASPDHHHLHLHLHNTSSSRSSSGNNSNNDNSTGDGNNEGGDKRKEVEVYVREKVRVESADPSLLSLSAKLSALSNTLGLARRNLAAVMGQGLEE
ncbi:RAVE subunit 2/Rogdi [Daldinia caldariorum]|uniref:RAVE subunit 2/Rogdi n=1 Tax=Daldinia caldariorum TaxID=326644 RepID=UPI00200817F0|nr:RAVE subunit 2/Rogdi [Daldinia caldariorum]KAI1468400.1 RAVE subunit 2/Rogdi [Daldinia caldariorum]